MREIDNRVIGESDGLEILELLEERGEDIEGFALSESEVTVRSRRVNWKPV